MKRKNSLHKDAIRLGGHGRSLQNKMSRTTKHNLDRQVDKRRRREGKKNSSDFS